MPRRPPPSAGHGDTWSYSSFPRGVSEQFVHGMVVQVSRKRLGPAKPPLASTFKTRFAARKVASKNQILSEAKDLAPVHRSQILWSLRTRPFSFLSFVNDAEPARSHFF